MKTKIENKNTNQNKIANMNDSCATIKEDTFNVIQAAAMSIVSIIAVTLGTIYGSML